MSSRRARRGVRGLERWMNPIIPLFSLPARSLCQGRQQEEEGNNRNVSHDGGRSLKRSCLSTPANCSAINPLLFPPLIFAPPPLPHNDYNKCEGDGFGRGALTCTLHLVHSDTSPWSLIIDCFLTLCRARLRGSLAESRKNWPAVPRSCVCVGGARLATAGCGAVIHPIVSHQL